MDNSEDQVTTLWDKLTISQPRTMRQLDELTTMRWVQPSNGQDPKFTLTKGYLLKNGEVSIRLRAKGTHVGALLDKMFKLGLLKT
jgi:hypothetical protein